MCISQSLFDYEYNNKFVRYPTHKVFCLLVQTNSFEGHTRNISLITRRTPSETRGWYRETAPEVSPPGPSTRVSNFIIMTQGWLNYHGDISDLDQLYSWYVSFSNSPLRVVHFECPFFDLLYARQVERYCNCSTSFTWPHNQYRMVCRRPQRKRYSGVIPLTQIDASLVRIYRLYRRGMEMTEPTLKDFLDFLAQVCRLYFGSTKVDVLVQRRLTRRNVHGLFSCVGSWLQRHCPGKVRYKTSDGIVLINKRKLPRSKVSRVVKTRFRRNRAELIICRTDRRDISN